MKNEFENNQFPCVQNENAPCHCLFPDLNNDCILSGKEILRYYGYQDVSIWKWCIVIIAMGIALRIIFWIMLVLLPGFKGKKVVE